MIDLPPKLRLKIYRFVLVYYDPIPLTQVSASDTSLLRTCRLFRREGTPLFYQHNRFVLEARSPQATSRICKAFKTHADLIRFAMLDVRLQASNHIDLIWDLTLLSRNLEATFVRALETFQSLQTLSIQLTTSCKCFQYRTQTEEILCTSFRESCAELAEGIGERCCEFGTIQVNPLDEKSTMIITTLGTKQATALNVYV